MNEPASVKTLSFSAPQSFPLGHTAGGKLEYNALESSPNHPLTLAPGARKIGDAALGHLA